MELALNQAKKNLGNTKTNPSVGCVIVKKNNLISAGCTSSNGRPHAEHNAINFSKTNIKNSDIYITLEPCTHFGLTSPCTSKIIKNKINKVYYSINDPDSRTNNKSKKILNKKGIFVKNGILRNNTNNFYRSYIKYKRKSLPFVTSKLAMSKDFYTIKKDQNGWITNKYSRGRVHMMRSNHDCIITSSKTVIEDNPLFTCRIKGLEKTSPARIILDKDLRIPLKSKIFTKGKNYQTIIFYNKENKKKIKLLRKLKIKTFYAPLSSHDKLNLIYILIKVKKLGFSRIFLESGITLIMDFLNKNLIDDFVLFISSKKLKKNGKGSITPILNNFIKNKNKLVNEINLLGDKLITYKLK
tara:strand:- start:297 stop:1361 length:1065 start_codon:yes stop_codon:yes gene_type:complete